MDFDSVASVWIVVVVAVVAVGFFALALSLTRIFKGHDIRGEVGTNPDMQRLGLKCPAKDDEQCVPDPKGCGDCELCSVGNGRI